MTTEAAQQKAEDKTAPVPAADVEADKLWNEFAKKHEDPHGSKAASEPEDAEYTEPQPGAEKAADTGEEEVKAVPAKEEPASKDAAPAVDEIWAKADKDPKTKALKDAFDKAPAEARPAIEAAQRDRLERGQEIARLRTTVSSFKRTPDPAPVTAAVKEKETPDVEAKRKKFKEDFPEYAEIVEAAEARSTKLEKKFGELEATTKNHGAVIDEVEAEKQSRLLHAELPDYTAAVKSKGFAEAFSDWLPSQARAIQDMAKRNGEYVVDANEVSTVFRLFKADTGFKAEAKQPPASNGGSSVTSPANGKRKQQLQSSAVVETRGTGLAAGADKNDGDHWWNHWAKRHAEEEARPN